MSPYEEFDDCVRNGSYCSSQKARGEAIKLMNKHRLGFLFNPGGGQFINRDTGFNCQIYTCDDVEDLNILRKALGENSQIAEDTGNV